MGWWWTSNPAGLREIVITALDGLPEDLGRLMRNVAVTVEHDPGRLACSDFTRAPLSGAAGTAPVMVPG